MNNREIQITNKNLIELTHKSKHKPYDYYNPDSDKVGIILNGEASTFFKKNTNLDFIQDIVFKTTYNKKISVQLSLKRQTSYTCEGKKKTF